MRHRAPRRLRIASLGKDAREIRRKLIAIAVLGEDGALRDRDAARLEALAGALRSSGWSFSLVPLELGALPDASVAEEEALFLCSAYAPALYAWLESKRLPLVGPSRASLELMRSRPRLKELWRSAGLATPSWFSVVRAGGGSGRRHDRGEIDRLVDGARDFPYVIKPATETAARAAAASKPAADGSPALSIAYDSRALERSVESCLASHEEIVVERFLEGAASFSVAAIGDIAAEREGSPSVLLPFAPRLKDERPIGAVTRGDLRQGLAEEGLVAGPKGEAIAAFSRRAIAVSGARDCARLEIVEQGGKLFALSLDPQPRIPDPWFRSCAAAVGLDEAGYVSAIFESALARQSRRGG